MSPEKKRSAPKRAKTPKPGTLAAAREILNLCRNRDMSGASALLQKQLDRSADITGALAWIHCYESGRGVDLDKTAAGFLTKLLLHSGLSPETRKRLAGGAADVFEKAIRDKNVCDEAKIAMPPFMTLAGRPFDYDEMLEQFEDKGEMLRSAALRVVKDFSDSPEPLSKTLESRKIVPGQFSRLSRFLRKDPATVEEINEFLQYGFAMLDMNPIGVSYMAAAMIAGAAKPEFSFGEAAEYLDVIRSQDTPRARWCLEVLANWPGIPQSFRGKAAVLAAELEGRGVKRRAPLAPGEFSHGLVTAMDENGHRGLVLFHRTPKGGMDMVMAMVGDDAGIMAINNAFEIGSDMEGYIRGDPTMYNPVTVALPFLRELVADALAIHEENGTPAPVGLFPFLTYYGDEPIKPRRRRPNLGAYMLETLRLTPGLVEGSEGLAKGGRFRARLMRSGAACEFCEKRLGQDAETLSSDDFDDFVKIMAPLERDRLLNRLATNLEVEALIGNAAASDNQAAAKLWLGIEENVVPLESVPYVRETAKTAVEDIVSELRGTDAASRLMARLTSKEGLELLGKAVGEMLAAHDVELDEGAGQGSPEEMI